MPEGLVQFVDTSIVHTAGWGDPAVWVEKPSQLTVAFRNLSVTMSNGAEAIAISAIEPASGGVVVDGARIDRTCCPAGDPFLSAVNNGPNKVYNVSVRNVTVRVSAQDNATQAANECSADLPATPASQGIVVTDAVCARAVAKADDDP